MTKTLYYNHDPMCSWCWAFKPTWDWIQSELEGKLNIVKLLGGLAPDSDEVMSVDMQNFLQQTWKKIQFKVPETKFNFDFWTNCQPRRSTYPACRAVIAARKQDKIFEEPMIESIQRAYYLRALNPSDIETHIMLAEEIGLKKGIFISDLNSNEVNETFLAERNAVGKLGIKGFPGLVFYAGDGYHPLRLDYTSPQVIIKQVEGQL